MNILYYRIGHSRFSNKLHRWNLLKGIMKTWNQLSLEEHAFLVEVCICSEHLSFEKFKSSSLATTFGGVMVSMFASGRIGSVMVSRLTLSVVDRGFKPRLSQTKDYKIGICCISAKHAALKRKSK